MARICTRSMRRATSGAMGAGPGVSPSLASSPETWASARASASRAAAHASRTARMLDAWAAAREADARALAQVSGLDASDGETPGPAPMAPDVARRMLRVQMRAIETRGNYISV